ncbi:hypothetical protein ACWDHW_08115 [Streptomyces melanosporofaciens]
MSRTQHSTNTTTPSWTINFTGAVEGDDWQNGSIMIQADGPDHFSNVVNDDLVLAIRQLITAFPEVSNINTMVTQVTTTVENVVPDEPEA